MCDTSAVRNCLLAALAAALAAIASIGIAAILNGSVMDAPGAPALMLIAAGSAAAAAGACGFALSSLDDTCACLAPQCAAECSNLSNLIKGTLAVLSIQATAALAAAIPALVPYMGIVPMAAIVGSLVVESLLLPSHIAFVGDLDDCAAQSAAAENAPTLVAAPGTTSSGLIVSSYDDRRWFFWRRFWRRFWKGFRR